MFSKWVTTIWFIIAIIIVVLAMLVNVQSATFSKIDSPCPGVFDYEAPGSEQDRWYGLVRLSTEYDLYGLAIDIILDKKADLVGNWFGDVTTKDNKEFKIGNENEVLLKGNSRNVRFFVKFGSSVPQVTILRLNGRQICPAAATNRNEKPPNVPPITSATTNRTSTSHSRYEDKPSSVSNVYVPLANNVGVQTSSSNENTYDRNSGNKPSQSTNRQQDTNRPSNVNKPSEGIRPIAIRPSEGIRPSVTGKQPDNTRPSDRIKPSGTILPVVIPLPTNNVKPSTSAHTVNDYDEEYDDVPARPNLEEDYFSGDFNPSSSIKKTEAISKQCGKIAPASLDLITYGSRTSEGKYPWHVAIYRMKYVDSTYICGGSLVNEEYVITAAHCVTRGSTKRPINKNILTLHLGKYNLRTSTEGVQVKFVSEINVHPEYPTLSTGNDIAILKLLKPACITNFVRPVCLWPEELKDISSVVGKTGAVVGWGYDESGHVTEELRVAQMPIIDELTCIRSFEDFFIKFTSNTTYCAGYLNGTSVCNGDSGGGMVFPLGTKDDISWHLRGLVSLSAALQNEAKCDPNHYIVFTDVAKFTPWIKSIVQIEKPNLLSRQQC